LRFWETQQRKVSEFWGCESQGHRCALVLKERAEVHEFPVPGHQRQFLVALAVHVVRSCDTHVEQALRVVGRA
jgi:hypothetical protein